MKFFFHSVKKPHSIQENDWKNWKWQLKKLANPYLESKELINFVAGATPYYYQLISSSKNSNLKKIIQPDIMENSQGLQSMLDPLGEVKHSPNPNLIHRYPDRVLFLVTDMCGVYCRYCTRKRFTGKKAALVSKVNYEKSLSYIKNNQGIREVILSGGDPLTLSDSILEKILQDLRRIDHIEIIRIGSRMPLVCPMRFTKPLLQILKKHQPVFLLTHFNHPYEISKEVAETLNAIADSGILIFNQTVLLNGINNHPVLIQALMRRLLYLRVKPYYMFQCDPSEGSDHFRTSIQNSEWIQQELWGYLSGLAMPNLSVDLPDGGGKIPIIPNFLQKKSKKGWAYKGWDGMTKTYKNPDTSQLKMPTDIESYEEEWLQIKNQEYGLVKKAS
ncbi:MAG: KamA family radical SAM protein [Bdellovibrionales bacterium]